MPVAGNTAEFTCVLWIFELKSANMVRVQLLIEIEQNLFSDSRKWDMLNRLTLIQNDALAVKEWPKYEIDRFDGRKLETEKGNFYFIKNTDWWLLITD